MTQNLPDKFAVVIVALELQVLVSASDVPNITNETVGQLVPHGTVTETRVKRVIPILEGTATDVSYANPADCPAAP